MLVFPNIKINLGLRILDRRSDGFHNLETFFYPVAVSDLLELIPSKQFSFSVTGIALPAGDNLCVKAWHLLRQRFSQLPEVSMYLHKLVPVGAGLGGGSSDAAHVLTAANQMFQLNLNEAELIELALQLGSDCPFFVVNKPCVAHGRGEILQRVDVDLKGDWIILVHTGLHISTAEAFATLHATRNIVPRFARHTLVELPAKHTWQSEFINQFEMPAFQLHPHLKDIRNTLILNGAYYAAMSGSGSTIYGLYQDEPEVNDAFIRNNYWVKKLQM